MSSFGEIGIDFRRTLHFSSPRVSSNSLRSQIATLNESNRGRADPMWSQTATGSKPNIRYKPWVFTEHGALQAANILRSDRAIAMSVYVIRAFIEQRERLAAHAAILKRLPRSIRRCSSMTPYYAIFIKNFCLCWCLHPTRHVGRSGSPRHRRPRP